MKFGYRTGSDHRVSARNGHGVAEVVVRRGIVGDELGVLRPQAVVAFPAEHVCRPGTAVKRPVASRFVAFGPDHRVGAGNRHGVAEVVRHRSVGGGELVQLRKQFERRRRRRRLRRRAARRRKRRRGRGFRGGLRRGLSRRQRLRRRRRRGRIIRHVCRTGRDARRGGRRGRRRRRGRGRRRGARLRAQFLLFEPTHAVVVVGRDDRVAVAVAVEVREDDARRARGVVGERERPRAGRRRREERHRVLDVARRRDLRRRVAVDVLDEHRVRVAEGRGDRVVRPVPARQLVINADDGVLPAPRDVDVAVAVDVRRVNGRDAPRRSRDGPLDELAAIIDALVPEALDF